MRKAAILTAALVAAVLVYLLATLPPRPLEATWRGDPALPARTVAGAYHVHTTRSDGAADKASVAAAAARAGLQFVLFTEHGDGSVEPDPPAYLSGVLCLDGVEISTNGGHYVALDLPGTPFPLGGEAATVVEDVRRFGGFGFIAHPDSPRAELAWTDWALPFDGVEWLNADTEWRDEPRPRMIRALFDYLVRPGPALASLLDRPVNTLTRWDALTTRRPVLALGGHDAHGGFGAGTEGGGWRGVPIPSYEASFATFSTRVVLERAFSGDPEADARQLLDAIRGGGAFTAIDGLAAPAHLEFRRDGAGLLVEASSVPGAEVIVLHADGAVIGREVLRSTDTRHLIPAPARGVYRVEVRLPAAPGEPPVPWIVSPTIRIGSEFTAAPAPPPPLTPLAPAPALSWAAEHDPSSSISVEAAGSGAAARFTLGGGGRHSQFVALAAPIPPGTPSFDGLRLDAVSDAPMRLSIQLRYAGGRRWGRSVFIGRQRAETVVATDALLPLDGQTGRAPDPSTAQSLLLVVDLVNALPGTTGRFEIPGVAWMNRQ